MVYNKETLGEPLTQPSMTPYLTIESRLLYPPKNLRDIPTRATTQIPEHLDIDQLIEQLS